MTYYYDYVIVKIREELQHLPREIDPTTIASSGDFGNEQESLQRLYRELPTDPRKLKEYIKRRVEIIDLGDGNDTRFRVLLFKPDVPDGSVIEVHSEFGHGKEHIAGVMRALSVQGVANPNAVLVMYLNDVGIFEPRNINFTKQELKKLCDANLDPYMSRQAAVLDHLRKSFIDGGGAITSFGPSMGATVAAGVAAHRDSPTENLVVIGAPDVTNRTGFDLMKAFVGCGKQLSDVIKANNYPEGLEKAIRGVRGLGLLAYGLGLVHRSNFATTPLLAKDGFSKNISTALNKGINVGHAWATGDNVSPQEDNDAIAKAMGGFVKNESGLYVPHEIDGDHSATNHNLIVALLVKELLSLAANRAGDIDQPNHP